MLKETALKWEISERRVRKLCEEGKISGIKRIGKLWKIPIDAVKPFDWRTAKGKELQSFLNELVDILRSNTKLEESELDLVAGGNNIMINLKRFTGASLATLSLLCPITNTTTFATEQYNTKTSTVMNQKNTNEKNKVKEIAKKVATYLLGGVEVFSGTAAVVGLVYVGYRYVTDIKHPVIIDLESRGNADNRSGKLKKTIADYTKAKKEFILISEITENEYKVERFVFNENKLRIVESVVNKAALDNILTNACKGNATKSGVYSGNEEVLRQIVTLQSIQSRMQKAQKNLPYVIDEKNKTVTITGVLDSKIVEKISYVIQSRYTLILESSAVVKKNTFYLLNSDVIIKKGAVLEKKAFNSCIHGDVYIDDGVELLGENIFNKKIDGNIIIGKNVKIEKKSFGFLNNSGQIYVPDAEFKTYKSGEFVDWGNKIKSIKEKPAKIIGRDAYTIDDINEKIVVTGEIDMYVDEEFENKMRDGYTLILADGAVVRACTFEPEEGIRKKIPINGNVIINAAKISYCGLNTVIKGSVTINKGVQISKSGFRTSGIDGDVIINEGAEISEQAFNSTKVNGNIIINKGAKISKLAFIDTKINKNVIINEGAEISYQAFSFTEINSNVIINKGAKISYRAFSFTEINSNVIINEGAEISDQAFNSTKVNGNIIINEGAKISEQAFDSIKVNGNIIINKGAKISTSAFPHSESDLAGNICVPADEVETYEKLLDAWKDKVKPIG